MDVFFAADTNCDPLCNFLQKFSNNIIKCENAPYNQVQQTLLSKNKFSDLLIWSSPDKQISSYSKIISFEEVSLENIFNEIDEFISLLMNASKNYDSIFLFTWEYPPENYITLGLANRHKLGQLDVLRRMNIYLSDSIKNISNIYLIDLSFLQSNYCNQIHDPRLFAIGRMRYSIDFMKYVAKKIIPILNSKKKPSRKVIICDLDNTLWGGIIGDDGVEGIKIGDNDPRGESYLELQKTLKTLKNRGIILAISSKNDSKIATDAISNHPNMLLKENDFSIKRINWEDKAKNIISILDELNLLPSSAVFLDDNPSERGRVKEVLPEILIPELGDDPSFYSSILKELTCFETLIQSNEDLLRTKSYLDEKERQNSKELFVDLEAWLLNLKLNVEVKQLTFDNLPRSIQLLNKTNQFNLKTRRLTEKEMNIWLNSGSRQCFTASTSDRYGDYGLIGFLTLEEMRDKYEIIDFVMSCRVFGKGVEDAILYQVKKSLNKNKIIHMKPLKSKKNAPIYDFLSRVAPEGKVLESIKLPKHVNLI